MIMLSVSSGGAALHTADSDKMYVLGSALTKLSASVESMVRYKNPPEGISDSEFLTLSTKHDPGLMEPFADYKVRIARQDGHVIVLVCDKAGKTGLLEDAGNVVPKWTGTSGRRRDSPKTCQFTLNAKSVSAQAALQ